MIFALFSGNYSLICFWRSSIFVLAVPITKYSGFFERSRFKTSLPKPLLTPVMMTLGISIISPQYFIIIQASKFLKQLLFDFTLIIQFISKSMKAHSPNRQHDPRTQPIFQFLPGPVKIKDGLFMGDEIAAKDIEFIISNKVTHVINTVSKQIPNLWQKFGIHYLSVNWDENQQNIFDKKNNAVNTIFHFIEEAMEQGESCLIHSVNSKSRACAVTVAYLMKKYSWSLKKCLEFISSKKENLGIRENYLKQMQELEGRMAQIYKLTSEWGNSHTEEQILLKNTFLNSKAYEGGQGKAVEKKTKKRVGWAEKPIVYKANQAVTNMKMSKDSFHPNPKTQHQQPLKSILKGFEDPSHEQTADESNSFEQFAEGDKIRNKKGDNGLINNINGNIVHVTVNNFITSEKKNEGVNKNPAQSRPYSSDQKDREKDKKNIYPMGGKKLFPYDQSGNFGFKNPYDNKGTGQTRAGSSGKALKQKRQEPTVKMGTYAGYERPQSAKNKPGGGIGYHQMAGKEELMVTNGPSSFSQGFGKKRYPSSTRDGGVFKRK